MTTNKDEIEIQIGIVGRILEGRDVGSYIEIEHSPPGSDSEDYFIYTSPNPDFAETIFDDWAQNQEWLKDIFRGRKWKIDWNPPGVQKLKFKTELEK